MMYAADSGTRHIRKGSASVCDRRYRNRYYRNKLRPTLCGAKPTLSIILAPTASD